MSEEDLMKRNKRAAKPAEESVIASPSSPAPEPAVEPAAGIDKMTLLCLDPAKPAEVRAKLLLDVLRENEAEETRQTFVTEVFKRTALSAPEAQVAQMKEHYEQALLELNEGAVRPATFVSMATASLPGPAPRAHVVTPDGQERYPSLHPRVRGDELRAGMTVYLDPKGGVVLGLAPDEPLVGQVGSFLRKVQGTLVEALLQNERLLVHAAAPVLDAIAAGVLRPGTRLLICPRRHVALGIVPEENRQRHRFVDRARVPDVIAERDIGRPHWVLDYLVRRLRVLLFRPDLLSRFDLRPRFAALLTGPTGCGKTLTIRAFLNAFDRILVERTGRRDLGSRVIRVKVSELLSDYLGRSDKNVEELFDDVRTLAAAEIGTEDGDRLRLPVVLLLEEVEGLARRRGPDSAVYDRVLTTLLQRLDDPTDDLGRLPLVLISTSNRPDLLDSAMARRLGVQARFTRLDREGLTAVLDKKLRPNYPYPAGPAARQGVLDDVVGWFYGPTSEDRGIVELVLKGGKKLIKRRRDFLTGGVVEQAVAGAIDRAAFAADLAGDACLTAGGIIEALRQCVDGLADSLSPENAADYLDILDPEPVMAVRRLREPREHLPQLLSDLDN
jgi:ATP-dependent 26S proteasome regulatory subunit